MQVSCGFSRPLREHYSRQVMAKNGRLRKIENCRDIFVGQHSGRDAQSGNAESLEKESRALPVA
jgi:hypothetical protein